VYNSKTHHKFKLPFDDNNVFGAFYTSFASGNNSQIIKRTYSGLGGILTPS
jgi:hypothetical protein